MTINELIDNSEKTVHHLQKVENTLYTRNIQNLSFIDIPYE